jgi:CubicO group peptidase (beta-lactamase class C family)
VRPFKALLIALLVLGGSILSIGSSEAQSSLPISLFERYVESLRQQVGIPGMSGVILQDGRSVWEAGFGYQDVESLIRATPDTPYPILDLTQTLASTLLLRQCVEHYYLEVSDRVIRWDPNFGDGSATVSQLLSHTSPAGGFVYDPQRFAGLTGVIDQCGSRPYAPLLTEQIFDRLGMMSSVPGADLLHPDSPDRRYYGDRAFDRYLAVVKRQATPYRVDGRLQASRSSVPGGPYSAATGAISTVRDLASFDAALDADVLISAGTRAQAWEPLATQPTGLGWFVQRYNGEQVVWHFGLARDAYSSLILKVPSRKLTLILLANSDGLVGPPYTLPNGNVTSNLFASLFLKLFLG